MAQLNPYWPDLHDVGVFTSTARSRVDLNTILAALRFYQERGMGDPHFRSDAIHDIATNGGDDVSMDSEAIDDLCERLNQ